MVREVVHEADIERQVAARNVLEEREDVLARRRREEVVGVLDALRDAFERLELAQGVALEERARLGVGNGGEDRHLAQNSFSTHCGTRTPLSVG